MELRCESCSLQFDGKKHFPKCLPCGHTICKECVKNGTCPTCKKDFSTDPSDHPDNICLIQMINSEGEPLRKKIKTENTEDTELQQQLEKLQCAVDAGRESMEQLLVVVPLTIEALHSLQDSAPAQLQKMEQALAELRRGAAGGDGAPLVVAEQVLQAAAQLEEGLRSLRSQCTVLAEQAAGGGARWAASAPQGPTGRNSCPLLQAAGELERAGGGANLAVRAPYVGPPGISKLTVREGDLDGGRLKVNDILRKETRWRDVRSAELRGTGAEDLLRVLAPQLEELKITDAEGPGASASVMEEVRKMESLRILRVRCAKDVEGYPDLPLQLEELAIWDPSENQLRCVERMSKLRSLEVWDYLGPAVSFPSPARGGLLWLDVAFNRGRESTLLSLIRAHAPSLQELRVYCLVEDDGEPGGFFFADLAERLAESGLVALRRLVLLRPQNSKCANISACLLQLRALRALLPATVGVSCGSCNDSSLSAAV